MTVGLLFAVVFVLGWIPVFVCRTEELTEALPSYRGPEWLWTLVTPILLATHCTLACATLSFIDDIPWWSAGLGLAVYGTAVLFWLSGRPLISPLHVRRLPDEPPQRLRRDGAFGVVRHPLYFSYLLACAAPVIVARRGLLVVTFALCALVLAVRAVLEERRLRVQLGAEYHDYCRSVKRLVPFVW
jgi:protein-S-isoprenylcysteine O-methyltransferase Ste14